MSWWHTRIPGPQRRPGRASCGTTCRMTAGEGIVRLEDRTWAAVAQTGRHLAVVLEAETRQLAQGLVQVFRK